MGTNEEEDGEGEEMRNPFLENIEASEDTRKWLAANVKEWDKKIMHRCAETGKHPSEVAVDIGRGMADERRRFKLTIIEEEK